MEENKNKKKKFPLIIILTMMIACCTVFAVLCAIGIMPIPTSEGGFIDLHTAALIKKASHVEDEKTLRELLLLKKELSIVVTEDIEIDETFIVKGNKTLYGNATISADVAGEYRTMHIFDVQPGAALTMNGLVLDGDGTADGINVGQDAELTYLSGIIQYMRYGIQTNGKVNFEGGLIQHITQAGILASYRSKVYVNGGHLYNANNHLIHVDTNGYVEVNEGADLSVCRGDAIFNAGDLYIYGGTIHDTVARAVNTEGKLHMEYKGSKKDGYIEMYNIGSIAVRMNAHDKCYISDVHAVNIGTNGVFTTDLRSNGKTTVENCIFDTCAIVEGNGMSVSRKVEINDVTVLNSQGGGINIRENGDVKIDGLTVDGTKGNCISVTGELEAKNLKLSNVGVNNMVLYAETEATVTDSVFGQTKRTNVFMTARTTLNMENVQIEGVKDDGIFAIQCNEGSTVNMIGDDNVISGATRVGVCLYKGATLNMEGGKICDNHGNATGAGVWVREEGSTFNMKGGTICDNSTTGSSGGVFVADKAIFNMSGGTITGNKADYSGGGVQVQGVMNMSGGTISNNYSKTTGGGINVGNNTNKKIYGKLNMTGGTISNNTAETNGGGISVSGKTTAIISGGTIKNNKAENIGNGIADNGYLTINPNAHITGNDVGLVDRSVVLRIKGNALNKHGAENRLVVTPHFKTKPKDYVVIECDSESASAAMLDKYIKSGNSVYTLLQKESEKQKIIVDVNDVKLDLNTTGAETVYVSNFEQLKEAVETTKTKRNIVLSADIVMESLITVPSGTVVNIRDDGQTRTLTRNEKHTTLFFETWYGTGLVLEGTSEGKLVLDGNTSGDVNLKNVNSLVKVRGTSEFTNVAFQNNGNTTASISGAFINSEYGYASVDGCTFTNGVGGNGGAIYSTADELAVKNSTFTNNTAKTRGGAIYNSKTTTVVENTTFKNNTAAGSGGAIHNASSAQLTLKGTTNKAMFEGNTVTCSLEKDNYGGGALCVGTGNVTITGYTFKDNKVVGGKGGAIEFNSVNTIATITDSTFIANKTVAANASDAAFHDGGAIWARNATTVADCTFTENSASGQGGAIIIDGKTLDIADSTFKGNKASVNGGAVYGASSAVVTIKGTKDTAIFDGNTANGTTSNTKEIRGGGAVAIGSGTFTLDGYTFKNNASKNSDGGAIQLNSTYTVANITNCEFDANSTEKNGGAIASKAKLTVATSTFTNNDATGQGGAVISHGKTLDVTDSTFGGDNAGNTSGGNGGAIYSGSNCAVTLKNTDDSVFKGNKSSANGGAICVGTGTLNVTGYEFSDNTSNSGGAIRLNNDKVSATISDTEFYGNTALNGSGGAIDNGNANNKRYTLTITDCTFGAEGKGNTASSHGGAIHSKAQLMVADTSFTGNSASVGGAVNCSSGQDFIVTDCTFEANAATKTTGEGGGAVAITSKTIAMFQGTGSFKNNTAACLGGAIYTDASVLQVSGYPFEENSASTGGAVYINSGADNSGTAILFQDITFENNKTTAENSVMNGEEVDSSVHNGAGGAIYNAGRKLSLPNAVFKKNEAADKGGAIYADNGKLTVNGGTFNENIAAAEGGAIAIWNGQQYKEADANKIENTTFTNNKATKNGGAVICHGYALTVVNSNFSGNSTSGTGGALYTGSNCITQLRTENGAKFENNFSGIKETDGTITLKANGGAIGVGTGTLEVENYTFTGNRAKSGGAIQLNNTGIVASFENAVFENNAAANDGNGGAIHNQATTTGQDALTLTNCTFGGADKGNTAKYGGVIFSQSSSVQITGTNKDVAIFQENATTSEGQGGAIYLKSGNVTVDGYTFDANSAKWHGGALYIVSGATATITNSDFVGNNTTGGYAGGAIWNDGVLTLTTVDFEGNKSGTGGGAINSEGGNIIAEDCAFTSNEAGGNGGAVTLVSGAAAEFKISTNGTSTFTDNTASVGGAIHANNAKLKVNGVTFSENTATSTGGAINIGNGQQYKEDDVNKIENATFTNNNAGGNGGAICCHGYALTVTNTNFSENSSPSYGGALYTGTSCITKLTTNNGAKFENNFVGTKGNDGNVTLAGYGGALAIGSGTLDVDGYTFVGNSAKNGGAVQINKSGIVATIEGAVFENNTAANDGNGGAIHNEATTTGKDALTITNCTFGGTGKANKAKLGAAIYNVSSSMKLIGTDKAKAIFQANETVNNGSGAAIYMAGGSLNADGYKFDANIAHQQGGAIWMAKSTTSANIQNSEFTGNSTRYASGGAIWNGGALTLTSTNFTSNSSGTGGAAINCEGGDAEKELTVNSCNFTSNVAKGNGGAIAMASGSVVELTGTGTFKSNLAGTVDAEGNVTSVKTGGAIHSNNVKLSVTGYTFDGNSATGDGGAIYAGSGATYKDAISIASSTFVNNHTYANGGAISSYRDLSITGSTFGEANKGNTSVGNGGAIYLRNNKTATVSGSTFTANSAPYGGAIYLGEKITAADETVTYEAGILNATGCTFTSNTASVEGGAIYVTYGVENVNVLDVDGCTFNGNTAVEGGAIKINEAKIKTDIATSVFQNNTASTYGGAICNYGWGGCTITDCTFGGEGTKADQYVLGNKATGNGGAIYHAKGGVITLVDNNASVEALFKNNKSSANGGAICIGSGTLNITGYDFVGNNAVDGGAIKLNNTSITANITGSTFESNRASSEGGAIYNDSTKAKGLTISEVLFTSNTSGGSGGAIFAKRGGTVLTTNTAKEFSGNTAGSSTSKQMGGAIYADIGTIDITGYTFTDNHAYSAGGAVRLAGSISSATFTNCTFTNNDALSGYGGAISNNSTSATEDAVTITDTKFESNDAVYGGAIHNRQSDLNLVGTKEVNAADVTAIFNGNTATTSGGALYIAAGKLDITKYQFVGNSVSGGNGGAICLDTPNADDAVTITGSVFKQNTASNHAGAIYVNTPSTVTIDGCQFGAESDDVNNPTKYGNKAIYGGAILMNENIAANVTIKNNSSFIGNEATNNDGGAIFAWTGSTLNVSNTKFRYNVAKANGGAIRLDKALKVVIEQDCLFEGNKTLNGYGGAIDHYQSNDVTIKNTDFVSNHAKNHGGAIRSEAGVILLENCDFTGNSTEKDGGAYRIAASAQVTLKNGTFSSNSAGVQGGAIQFNTGKVSISNYVFTGNTVNGSSNSINTNNCGGTHYTQLTDCIIEPSDIKGAGVK